MRNPVFKVISDQRLEQGLTIARLAEESGLTMALVVRAVVTGEGSVNTATRLLDTLGYSIQIVKQSKE